MRVSDTSLRPASGQIERGAERNDDEFRVDRTPAVTGADEARADDPERAWRDTVLAIDAVQPTAKPASVTARRLSPGVLRQEMSALLETFRAVPDADRADRAACWVLRTELRKLEALDRYVSGFIRG